MPYRYLITYQADHFGPFYSNYYDYVNNYDEDAGMVAFDLLNHVFTIDGKTWKAIPENHL